MHVATEEHGAAHPARHQSPRLGRQVIPVEPDAEHSRYRAFQLQFARLLPQPATCNLRYSYPFTAPLASPAMKSRCSTKNSSATGRIDNSVPAIKIPRFVWYSGRLIMFDRPIGNVSLSGVCSITCGHKKLFHAAIKLRSVYAPIIGRTIGSATSHQSRASEHPSIRPACKKNETHHPTRKRLLNKQPPIVVQRKPTKMIPGQKRIAEKTRLGLERRTDQPDKGSQRSTRHCDEQHVQHERTRASSPSN